MRPIILTKEEDRKYKKYRCTVKAGLANKRFEDKICSLDVFEVLRRFNYKCAYCNSSLPEKYWQLDHFYPKSMGGKNVHNNLVPTCRWCNTMKNALDGHAFILKCKSITDSNQIEKFIR